MEERATSRKEASIRRLTSAGVTPPEKYSLPPAGPRVRSAREVALRSLCLGIAATHAQGADSESIAIEVEKWGLGDALTPEESRALTPEGDAEIGLAMSYEHEGCFMLMWAMGLIEDLPGREFDDVDLIGQHMNQLFDYRSLDSICQAIRWRNDAELLDELDYLAQYRQIYLALPEESRAEPKGSLAWHAVLNRYRALEWLMSGKSVPWDSKQAWGYPVSCG
ncbi:MAG: DUF4272 domain-containing protein [Deltaproteobacteria bacterium]|nr:DUF4272 domain-containing protein [Deltaproteobacteria bacterium]